MIGAMAAVALAAGQAAASRVHTCPPVHAGVRLRGFTLFDGPIDDDASLAPATSIRTGRGIDQKWDVAGVYRAGRALRLRCDYGGRADLVLRIAQPVAACHATIRPRAVRIACR